MALFLPLVWFTDNISSQVIGFIYGLIIQQFGWTVYIVMAGFAVSCVVSFHWLILVWWYTMLKITPGCVSVLYTSWPCLHGPCTGRILCRGSQLYQRAVGNLPKSPRMALKGRSTNRSITVPCLASNDLVYMWNHLKVCPAFHIKNIQSKCVVFSILKHDLYNQHSFVSVL